MKSMPILLRNETSLSICKRLLGGELAAVDIYGRILRRHEGDPAAAVLRQVRDEHERAAELLRAHMRELGGGYAAEPGGWGTWSEIDVASVFGDSIVFQELQRNEARWCETHREALKEEALSAACKELIRFELLPRTEANVESLQSLSSLTPEACGGGRFPFVPDWP